MILSFKTACVSKLKTKSEENYFKKLIDASETDLNNNNLNEEKLDSIKFTPLDNVLKSN